MVKKLIRSNISNLELQSALDLQKCVVYINIDGKENIDGEENNLVNKVRLLRES